MIHNNSRNTLIADKTVVANTMVTRMKGLLGRQSLEAGEALVITPCSSIHMLFMKFPIDAIFIDRKGTVVGLCPDIRPFRLSPFFPKAHSAIELPSGVIAATQTQMGDSIQIS